MLESAKKFYVRSIHLVARHVFPSSLRVFLHKLRGVNIGKNVYIGLDVHIDDDNTELITIEDGVYIAPECMILTHKRDMSNYKYGMWVGECKFKKEPVKICKGAHIGSRVLIFPGVTVNEGAVIGAYSLVTKDVPPYTLALGIPAKVVKEYKV